MGSPLPEASWDGFTGAYYSGAGGVWEPIWGAVALGLIVLAIVVGLTHEKLAYRRMKREINERS